MVFVHVSHIVQKYLQCLYFSSHCIDEGDDRVGVSNLCLPLVAVRFLCHKVMKNAATRVPVQDGAHLAMA